MFTRAANRFRFTAITVNFTCVDTLRRPQPLAQIEVINGTTHTTSYEYDDDNRITSKTTDGITVEYTYDGLGRVTQQITKNGDTTVKTETYTFSANSAQVHTYRTQAGGCDVTYTYTYDDNGNILTVNDGTNTTSYEYDSQNQILRENNPEWGFSKTWSYDEAGNILTNKRYAYTAGALSTPNDTIDYTYGDETWGDLLTAYDGTAITHDEIGNPTSYRGRTFGWEHGRQLSTIHVGASYGTYTYDSDGMRIGRTYGDYANYKYVYNGSQLVQMEYISGSADIFLEFTYDAQGTPQTVSFNGTVYYYVTNLQGDVLRIVDSEGTIIARYLYDAYGATAMASSSFLGQLNPLRYRGYVFDHDTAIYYLQSRYYDSGTGRFLNADAFTSTGQGLTGNNMFAYCGNNPVNRSDPTGETETATLPGSEYWWVWLLGLADGPSPLADLAITGIFCFLGFSKKSDRVKDNLPDESPNSNNVNWNKSDDNHRNHVLFGTDRKHVPGWERMGINTRDSSAWAQVLPFLKDVVDKGCLTRMFKSGNGYVFEYTGIYLENNVRLVVTIFYDVATKTFRLSDAIPYLFK